MTFKNNKTFDGPAAKSLQLPTHKIPYRQVPQTVAEILQFAAIDQKQVVHERVAVD
jgi:hypothetical protein